MPIKTKDRAALGLCAQSRRFPSRAGLRAADGHGRPGNGGEPGRGQVGRPLALVSAAPARSAGLGQHPAQVDNCLGADVFVAGRVEIFGWDPMTTATLPWYRSWAEPTATGCDGDDIGAPVRSAVRDGVGNIRPEGPAASGSYLRATACPSHVAPSERGAACLRDSGAGSRRPGPARRWWRCAGLRRILCARAAGHGAASVPARRARTSPTVRSRLVGSGSGRCALIW